MMWLPTIKTGVNMHHLKRKTSTKAGLIATLALAGMTTMTTAVQAQPDFSGAWTTYRAPAAAAGAFSAPAEAPKLTAAAQAAVADYQSVTQGTDYSPGNACVGGGMPSSMLGSGGYPMEIIQRPDQVFVIYEAHSEMRRLFIGDEAQDPSQFFPERNGYSSAHWEGDRLVVETVNLKTQVDTRYPHSDQATIREEYYFDKPLDDGTAVLAADLSLTDPQWLEEPFKTTKRWQAMADYHVKSYECTEPKWLDDLEKLYETKSLKMVQE
jgi:hypothetical protein